MPLNGDPERRTSASAWYRQPMLWLAFGVFAVSIAGCVWLILVSVRYADTPVSTSRAVFGVPVSARSTPHPAPPGARR